MATYIAIDDTLPRHIKTRNLKRLLGLKTIREALSLVMALWLHTLEQAWRDGDLEGLGDEGIADICEWDDDPAKLIKGLRECGPMRDGKRGPGFLVGYKVHNWRKRAHKLIKDRLYREARKAGTEIPRGHKPPESGRVDADDYRRKTEELKARRATARAQK